MRSELTVTETPYYPRVPLWRRVAAFAIDFWVAVFISSILSGSVAAQVVVFAIAWLGLRVVVVVQNYGQSLGRWALDMRVIDTKFDRGTPGMKELTKREAIAGGASALALLGLGLLSPTTAWGLLFFLPLAADCGFAWLDRTEQKAFHDQIAKTRVVQTQRGYSLDLKLKRLLADAQNRMRK